MALMSLASRSLAIRALGALLVAVAALATVALVARAQTPEPPPAAPPAETTEGVTITIQPPNEAKPVEIALAEVGQDIETAYKLANADGTPPRTVTIKGSSVLEVLEASQTNFNYSRIDIAMPDGGTFTVTKDQINDVKPPVFWTDDQGVTRFIGPPGDDGVVPAEAQFEVSGALTMTQHPPPRLDITLRPDEKKVKLGGSVSFAAKVTGAKVGEVVLYEWTQRGTANGKKWDRWAVVGGAGATHTQKFPRKDRLYQVRVAAWVEGDRDGSVVAVAEITVGDPKLEGEKDDEQDAGSGDGGSSGGSSGGSGTGYGGGGYSDGGYSGGYTPAYTPPAYTPPPAPAPPPLEPVPDSPDSSTSTGTTVEGNLLADASDPPPTSLLESAAEAARDRQPSDADGGASVPEAAISIVGVLALLGLGAGLEFREGKLPRLRIPRLPLPRRGA